MVSGLDSGESVGKLLLVNLPLPHLRNLYFLFCLTNQGYEKKTSRMGCNLCFFKL